MQKGSKSSIPWILLLSTEICEQSVSVMLAAVYRSADIFKEKNTYRRWQPAPDHRLCTCQGMNVTYSHMHNLNRAFIAGRKLDHSNNRRVRQLQMVRARDVWRWSYRIGQKWYLQFWHDGFGGWFKVLWVWYWALNFAQLFTHRVPYADIKKNIQVIKKKEKPDGIPDWPQDGQAIGRGLDNRMWGLLCLCWSKNPQDRPSIDELVMQLWTFALCLLCDS